MSKSSESTYAGDSPGKRVMRARMWLAISNWMNAIGSPYLGSVVLAGHGGDLCTMQGLGFDLSRVTGVDYDANLVGGPDSVDPYCPGLYPEAQWVRGDLAQAVSAAMARRGSGTPRGYKLVAPGSNVQVQTGVSAYENFKKRTRQHSTIFQIKRPMKFLYNSGHIDFCNGIDAVSPMPIIDNNGDKFRVPNMMTIGQTILGAASYPAIFGITFLKGREFNPRWPKDLIVPKVERWKRKKQQELYRSCDMHIAAECLVNGPDLDFRQLNELAAQRIKRHWKHQKGMLNCFQPLNRNGNLTALGKAMARAETTRQILDVYLFGTNLECTVLNVWGYQSGTKEKNGVPLCTFLLAVGPTAIPQENQIGTRDLCVRAAIHQPMLWGHHNMTLEWGVDALKLYALDLCRHFSVDRVAEILEMGHAKDTITAWKAHDTMGTYLSDRREAQRNGYGFVLAHTSQHERHRYGWGDTYIAERTNSDGDRELVQIPLLDRGRGGIE